MGEVVTGRRLGTYERPTPNAHDKARALLDLGDLADIDTDAT